MTNNLTPRPEVRGRSSVSIPISTSTLRLAIDTVGSIWVTSRSPPIQAAMAWALRVRSAERGIVLWK